MRSVLEGIARGGKVSIGQVEVASTDVSDGPAEIYVRPSDLEWSSSETGIPVTVQRVIDRPHGRRILAETSDGFAVELDADHDLEIEAHDQGFVRVRRANVYALGR